MKATGIVRRIDDLGRIVIPKEIRKNMKLAEGDPVEFFTAQGNNSPNLILAKYNPTEEEPQPQEEKETYTFTINVDSEFIGTIKVDKKQNDLLDWLFNNGCFHDSIEFEAGSPELVDFTK